MSIDLQKLNRMLAVKVEDQPNQSTFDEMAAAKLQRILAAAKEDYDAETYAEISGAINAFIAGGSVQKAKLYHYCLDFIDPSLHYAAQNSAERTHYSHNYIVGNISIGGSNNKSVEVVNHRYFSDTELDKLRDFVKTHADDKNFGDVVYEMMDRRGLTAPQLYRRAMLSRQDFNRITDPRCKNVTRSMVWNVILGLHCTVDEADYVLFSAGYRRRNDKFDLTLTFFLEHNNYDINAVNAVLADSDLKPLSCYVPVVD